MKKIFNIERKKLIILNYITIFIISLISYINCYESTTWILEVIPVYIGLIIIAFLGKKKIQISNLLHIFISIQMLILIIGGHYSYARVPLFDYFKVLFDWSRNNYDKVGHFIQGVTPFLIMKEILVKKNILKKGFLLNFICICTALAFSAFYELIEFSSAIILGSGADDFLGTQGDVWDTQKDMLFALIGSIFISLSTIKYKYSIKIN